MATQEQVVAAFTELRRRLAAKGVVMDPTSKENGQNLVAHLIKNGWNQQDVDADMLHGAFNALWPTGVIKFEKGHEPGPLKPKAPLQGTLSAVAQNQKDADARAAARKAQEEKEAEAKKEADAEKSTNEAITNFALTNGGRICYAKTDDFKKLLKLNVEKFRRDGLKWQAIFPIIKGWIADKYKEHEDEMSKSVGGGVR